MLRLPWITAEPVAVPHRLRQLSRWRRLHGSPNHRFSMVFLLIILMNTDDIIRKFRWFGGYPHTVDPCWSVGWSRNMLMKHDGNGWKTLMKHDETGWNLWNPMKMIKLWPWDQSFKSGHWICLYHSHGLWNAIEWLNGFRKGQVLAALVVQTFTQETSRNHCWVVGSCWKPNPWIYQYIAHMCPYNNRYTNFSMLFF